MKSLLHIKLIINWLFVKAMQIAGRNNWLDKNLMLYTAMVVHGANMRAVTRQLRKSHEPMFAQVDLVLTCGLCPTCKARANAVIYKRTAEDQRIDIEWEQWEQARARQERLNAAENEAELRKWGLL